MVSLQIYLWSINISWVFLTMLKVKKVFFNSFNFRVEFLTCFQSIFLQYNHSFLQGLVYWEHKHFLWIHSAEKIEINSWIWFLHRINVRIITRGIYYTSICAIWRALHWLRAEYSRTIITQTDYWNLQQKRVINLDVFILYYFLLISRETVKKRKTK